MNVEGVLNGIRVFAPRLVEGGRESRIVNTGSEHSLGIPFPGSAVYTASKHAVLAISDVEAAFAEQAPRSDGDDRYDVAKATARIRAERAG